MHEHPLLGSKWLTVVIQRVKYKVKPQQKGHMNNTILLIYIKQFIAAYRLSLSGREM